MVEAHRAGFVVDEIVITKAADFVSANLPSPGSLEAQWKANRLAYQLYVLSEYKDLFNKTATGELGLAVRLFDKRDLLSRYGRATLAVALSLLEPEEKQRVNTLLSDLAGDAVVSAAGTHWEEDQPDYWNMNTDIRTTGTILWAMSRLQPESNLLANVVRWLMAMRKEGHWQTTQGTAWSLLALVEYMRASGELQGDFGYTVYLNGAKLASGTVSEENIDESSKLQVEIASLLVDEGNRLVIERQTAGAGQTGKGQLYYTAYLRYYLPAEQVKALDRGIVVARQYSPVDRPEEYIDTAQVGDVVKVKLTLIAPTDLYYVVVEDPLPAGFEGVDLSLKTTSVVGEQPELTNLTAADEDRWYRRYGWGWWWFSHTEMRDEKVALFAQYLPRGTYEYTYLMRASVPGEFLTMPALAYEMYFPEVFGRSDGGKFAVEPVD
jgi:alpha-2-macroglobulin